ncbi:NADH:flavin oxidoreductase/NADH oxidase [Pantoea sp. B9002]|uniref:NADH:flavin oxidoreductase/NADH oxidase n=1 Tax=Pantoea sp. B9002 TaxID=2726979 RepID=UPI0015A1846C|nr:NADH:flavin oxidoreductase/NADH oxidase [Pantoea sp. B9002]NWA63188.1 NADH:flavin oxidoreductase/NADH oxidase [Pantoea sp. B9002]
MPGLFSPFTLKDVTLRNRIVVSPMCQYQSTDGYVNDWHMSHYAMLAKGGSGLVILEATAVTQEGRITPGDLGLWSNNHTEGMSAVASSIKRAGAVPGIQLGHAGRKAGCTPPWLGGKPLDNDDLDSWTPVGPSAVPFFPASDYVPREMSLKDITRVRQDFTDAARRARDAEFKWLELHFAHGFLVQSFLSSESNLRSDQYGGPLENRARFMLEIIEDVKKVWPDDLPLTVRLGAVEFNKDPESSFMERLKVAEWLKKAGTDLIDVGLALTTPSETVPWAPGFMVPYAQRLRHEVNLPVGTSWLITDARAADQFIQDEKTDLVYLARALLANPHWPYKAASELSISMPEAVLPTPYSYWLQNWSA